MDENNTIKYPLGFIKKDNTYIFSLIGFNVETNVETNAESYLSMLIKAADILHRKIEDCVESANALPTPYRQERLKSIVNKDATILWLEIENPYFKKDT